MRTIDAALSHRLLGPRVVYLIGSANAGRHRICAATNVTCIGTDPCLLAIALMPEWESTRNILRSGELTVNLLDYKYKDAAWVAGSRYSGVAVNVDEDKYMLAGLDRMDSLCVAPAGVAQALAILECRVRHVFREFGNHIVFVADVLGGRCGSSFDDGGVLDLARAQPLLQVAGNVLGRAAPAPPADTARCNAKTQVNRAFRDTGASHPSGTHDAGGSGRAPRDSDTLSNRDGDSGGGRALP